MRASGLPALGERLQLRIGNTTCSTQAAITCGNIGSTISPAEGVRETCLAKLGRLAGELVIEREDVGSVASSIEGELLPNDRS